MEGVKILKIENLGRDFMWRKRTNPECEAVCALAAAAEVSGSFICFCADRVSSVNRTRLQRAVL